MGRVASGSSRSRVYKGGSCFGAGSRTMYVGGGDVRLVEGVSDVMNRRRPEVGAAGSADLPWCYLIDTSYRTNHLSILLHRLESGVVSSAFHFWVNASDWLGAHLSTSPVCRPDPKRSRTCQNRSQQAAGLGLNCESGAQEKCEQEQCEQEEWEQERGSLPSGQLIHPVLVRHVLIPICITNTGLQHL